MHLLVTGATGLAGSEVIRQAILDKSITRITALVRRPISITHDKLTTVIHKDFSEYSSISDLLSKIDACIWCLGISQTQVNKQEYNVITFDYTLAAANALLKNNKEATFVFLSGQGADSKEKSWTTFARVKGKTENALKKLNFKQLYLARPAGIVPIHKKENAAFFERILIPLYPFFEKIIPFMFIRADVLAQAMINVAKNGFSKTILENNDLKLKATE